VVNAYLAVMIGGAVGAGGRYAVGTMLSARLGPAFPWGRLAVNLIGGLAIGLLAGWLSRSGNDQLRLLLIVGVLGGFTTFSAFGLDAVELIGRGQLPRAMAYIAASVAGSIMLTALGLALARAS
jgi:fluoride exporter